MLEEIERYTRKYKHKLNTFADAYYFLMGVLIAKGYYWDTSDNELIAEGSLGRVWNEI